MERANSTVVRRKYSQVFVFATFFVIVALAIEFLVVPRLTGRSSGSEMVNVVADTVIGYAFVLVGLQFVLVNRIEITNDAIDFYRGTTKLSIKWPDLVAPNSPYLIGIVFRYKVQDKIQTSGGLNVDRGMARAILSDPRCPHFELDPKIRSSLGLPAE
jgi:hypothetical protein